MVAENPGFAMGNLYKYVLLCIACRLKQAWWVVPQGFGLLRLQGAKECALVLNAHLIHVHSQCFGGVYFFEPKLWELVQLLAYANDPPCTFYHRAPDVWRRWLFKLAQHLSQVIDMDWFGWQVMNYGLGFGVWRPSTSLRYGQ